MKYTLVLGLITLAAVVCGRPTHDGSLMEGEKLLNKLLLKFAARKDGPHYKISKVISVAEVRPISTKYPVKPGALTLSINVDLLDKHGNIENCNVGITGKPVVEKGYLVSFWCTDNQIIFKYLNN